MQKIIIGFTGILLTSLIVWIFWYISQTTLTTQLSTLFNVLLAIFSVLLSLVISHFYFDSSRRQNIESIKNDYKKNNKLYSQKAAEKVDNLSNELTKLSFYLQQSIEDDNDYHPETALLVREEKIRSAIHIVETLKSINDKSLSDWLGVLDEEDIEEQNEMREEIREERENDFKQILDNYRSVIVHGGNVSVKADNSEYLENVHLDISELNRKIDKLATSMIGTPIKTSSGSITKEKVQGVCPNCGREISYRQRPSESSVRKVKCPGCDMRLISTWNTSSGFTLDVKPPKTTTTEQSPRILSDDEVNRIRDALPEQPWPKGTSHDVATKLGVSHADIQRAIDTLVQRGDVKLQMDGVLYEIAKLPPTKKTRKAPAKKVAEE